MGRTLSDQKYTLGAAHILKLEGYREDSHGFCARMAHKFVMRFIFLKNLKNNTWDFMLKKLMQQFYFKHQYL